MRLLIVTHYFPDHRGGIEIVAGELARRLARDGVDVVWAASGVTATRGAPGAVPMKTWNITENRLGFPYPLWSPAGFSRLRHLVAGCDVVHLHDSLYLGNAAAARLARQLGKSVVVTQHIGEVPYRNPVLRGLLRVANRTLARRVLTSCDRCVFISPRVRDFFSGFVRFRSPPLYWPNGVDLERFRPVADVERVAIRSRLGWSTDRPVFFFAGRFVEKKGLKLLHEAARQLPEADFVFAGWGPLDPAMWGLPNVRCAGSLSTAELVPYYQAADLLVLPSMGEGFPLVVQEAAACGTPALISQETALGHPLIFPFTQVVEPTAAHVVTQLKQWLGNPARHAIERELVAVHARTYWDWDKSAAAYGRLFRELAKA